MKVAFLQIDDVVKIHVDQIERYGGIAGIRDLGLLESAIAAAESSFSGTYLHGSIPEMAAAYLFHLAQNHPFLDGNKRAAAASMFLFLYLNDLQLECTEDELVDLTMAVASGRCTKAEAAVFVGKHCCPTEEG